MLVSRPRGTNDILPEEAARWRRAEALFHHLFLLYGFGEVRTPVFEHTELFERGVGEASDIVEKEMYTFPDRAGRRLTLRPEGTAPVVRAYLENGLHAAPQPVKLYYVSTPMFRYSRPAAGRYRQFHQSGCEVLGTAEPLADAEVVALARACLEALGLDGVQVLVNSIGCPACRPPYREALRAYYRTRLEETCPDCRRRWERNPLRLLDCKDARCRALAGGAPVPLNHLCDQCRGHLEAVRRFLAAAGVPHRLEPTLVRGLDYYTRTVFELAHPRLGLQASLGGGGRYDGLVEELGGPSTPAAGFALGMERLLETTTELTLAPERPPVVAGRAAGTVSAPWAGLAVRGDGVGGRFLPTLQEMPPPVFVAAAGGEEVRRACLALTMEARRRGLPAELDLMGRSLKAQLKHAARLGARTVLILGEDELARGSVLARDMATGEQREVAREEAVALVAGA